ncbi:MAG: pilus assembly PilX N-terminal domain-containing protein [Gaiellaceae bacterium]
MLKRLTDESGIALALSLLVMIVLTISTTSVIYYTTSNQDSSQLSLSRDGAYRLAEAGINNAMAVLGSPPDPATGIGNNALDKNVFCGMAGRTYTSTSPDCVIKDTYSNGYVIWKGVLSVSGVWTITSTGYVVNPNVHAAATVYSVRTLSVTVGVHPTLTQPLNTPVWNYIYATKPASTPPTCDESLTNSVQVASPFYVEGNLCLFNTSSIVKGPLVVKGRLIMNNVQQNYAGTSVLPLSDAHIVNGCTASATHVPCNWNGSATVQGLDKLWATTLDATPPANLSPPVPQWDNWYLNASPGPFFPCQTINGQAPLSPLTFDTNAPTDPAATDAQKLPFQDNSVIAPQDLTPGYDYRCQTTGGELSWNNTTKLLTIKGTVYIDGSVFISNGAVNRYTGQGVIYLGGTLLVKNSSLCGAIYNGACDERAYQTSPAQGWNPNATLLCFVAKRTGGQVDIGDSAQFVSAHFQGAVFANGNIDIGTTSNVDGPLVGLQVILGQSVTTSFPSITIVPQGMPSNPTAYAQIDPPTSYSG